MRVALTLLFGVACFAGGFVYNELSRLYSSIRLEMDANGKVTGFIPQHFGNRDNRAIAGAVCHGDQLIEGYEENITVMGGADFVRFSCAN